MPVYDTVILVVYGSCLYNRGLFSEAPDRCLAGTIDESVELGKAVKKGFSER